MMACPHCGAQNSERRQTCYQCTKPMAAREQEPPRPSANVGGRLLELEQGEGPITRPLRPAAEPSTSHLPPEVKLSPVKQAALSGSMFYGSRGQVKQAAVFFRELSSLLNSGMGMAGALSHLENRVGMGSRGVARTMGQVVAAGKPLSEAMAQHAGAFLSYQVGLVQAAELSGALPQVLNQIAVHLETDYKLRLDLAMRTFLFKIFYIPMILISAPFLFILAGDPTKLGSAAAAIQLYQHYFTLVSLPIGLALLLLWLLWPHLVAIPLLQRAQDRVLQAIPLVGKVFRLATLSRFTGMLSALWGSGLAPGEALDAAAVASGSRQVAMRVFQLSPELTTGVPLSSVLERTRLFEPELAQHLRVGEVSGNLPEALSRLAERYQYEYEHYSQALPKAAYVGLLVVIGGIVVWMSITYLLAYVKYAWEMPLQEVERTFRDSR